MGFNKLPVKEVAKYYRSVNLMPIPVKEKQSVISWGDYTHNLASEEQVDKWFTDHPNGGIALLTGPVSKTIVLDIDGQEAMDTIKKAYELPKTWIAKTRKGYHFYFKWTDRINVSTTLVGLAGLKGVDLRGRGGYVVAPPSYGVYQWVNGYSPWEIGLAEIPAWLESLVHKHHEKPESGSTPRSLESGWVSELLQGVGAGERHQALVKLAGYFFSHHPEDIARELLESWNGKNDPPIPDDEFQTQVDDMAKRYRTGQYRVKNTPDYVERKASLPSKPLQPISINQLLDVNVPNVQWLIQGVLPVETAMILAGWQKLGKSWMTLDLAVEMARGGGRWMDYIPVDGGNVMYIDNESALQLLKYRMNKLMAGKGKPPLKHHVEFYVKERFKLTDDDRLQELKKRMSEVKPKLVIVDSFASSHNLDENRSADMRYFFDDLIGPLTKEFKTSFLFIDHEGKGLPDVQQDGGHRLRGSSAKGDAADVVMSLRKDKNCLIVEHSNPRYGKPIANFVISVDDVGENATRVVSLGKVGG